MPVLQVHLGAPPAECVNLLLPLHELLHAELQEVQGAAADGSNDDDDGDGGQQQQQQQYQGAAPGSAELGPQTEGELRAYTALHCSTLHYATLQETKKHKHTHKNASKSCSRARICIILLKLVLVGYWRGSKHRKKLHFYKEKTKEQILEVVWYKGFNLVS